MAATAEGTGGTFYHGTNDFDEGIARTAAAPEYLYVLAYSPLDLKLDGKFHNLNQLVHPGLKLRHNLGLSSLCLTGRSPP